MTREKFITDCNEFERCNEFHDFQKISEFLDFDSQSSLESIKIDQYEPEHSYICVEYLSDQ